RVSPLTRSDRWSTRSTRRAAGRNFSPNLRWSRWPGSSSAPSPRERWRRTEWAGRAGHTAWSDVMLIHKRPLIRSAEITPERVYRRREFLRSAGMTVAATLTGGLGREDGTEAQ